MNIISEGKNYLFDGNRVFSFSKTTFPLYLSYVSQTGREISFLQNTGTFSSYFHEPHIAALSVTPGFLWFFSLEKTSKFKKGAALLFYGFFMTIIFSVTNILVLLVVFLAYVFIYTNTHSQKGNILAAGSLIPRLQRS